MCNSQNAKKEMSIIETIMYTNCFMVISVVNRMKDVSLLVMKNRRRQAAISVPRQNRMVLNDLNSAVCIDIPDL